MWILSVRFLVMLLVSYMALPMALAGKNEGLSRPVSPASNSMKSVKTIKDPTAAQEFLQRQIDLARGPAEQAAKDLNVEDTSCCYFATSTFAQLETGHTLSAGRIRFNTKFIQAEDIRRVLPGLVERDVLFYDDINFVEQSAPLADWLKDNLLEGEPVMLLVGINSPYEEAPIVSHSVNAVKVGGEINVIDPAYEVSSPAQHFFDYGTHWYKVDLSEPVALIRTVRDGVDYPLRARDIRLRKYWLNDQRLDLRQALTPGQLQQNFNSDQLRQHNQQRQTQPHLAECR